MTSIYNQADLGTPVKNQILTVAQKTSAIRQLIPMEVSYGDVARSLKIKKGTLMAFTSKYRRGKILREKEGRPPRLDDRSLRIISDQIALYGNIGNAALYKLIRDQSNEIWLRNHSYESENDVPKELKKKMKICSRSVTRYAKKLLANSF